MIIRSVGNNWVYGDLHVTQGGIFGRVDSVLPTTFVGGGAALNISGDGAPVYPGIAMLSAPANSVGSCYIFPACARGTVAAPTAIQNNDDLFFLAAYGYGATTWKNCARMRIRAKGNYTDTDFPADISFWTAPATGSAVERVTIGSAGETTFTGRVLAADGTEALPGIAFASDPNCGIMRYAGDDLALVSDGSWTMRVRSASVELAAPYGLDLLNGKATLVSEGDYIIALRNGANAQVFRGYASYTDSSNYTRWALTAAAGSPGNVTLAAESAGTGSANIDLVLTPKGTGNVSFPGGTLLKTTAALTDGAAAAAGTLLNSPAAGNPTKWIPINDNGTTRYIPAW